MPSLQVLDRADTRVAKHVVRRTHGARRSSVARRAHLLERRGRHAFGEVRVSATAFRGVSASVVRIRDVDDEGFVGTRKLEIGALACNGADVRRGEH